MTAKTAHQYPDHTLEEALRKRGFQVVCHWQEKGPKNTQIAWMEYLFVSDDFIYGGMIVQTFKGGGWTVYVEPTNLIATDANVEAVIATLKHKE